MTMGCVKQYPDKKPLLSVVRTVFAWCVLLGVFILIPAIMLGLHTDAQASAASRHRFMVRDREGTVMQQHVTRGAVRRETVDWGAVAVYRFIDAEGHERCIAVPGDSGWIVETERIE